MLRPLLLVLPLLATGCYAKFKKAAPYLDTVDIQTFQVGPPFVFLGKAGGDDLVSAMVNVAQAVQEAELTERIVGAVDVGRVNTAMSTGLADGLGGGPPFAYADAAPQGLVQLEVTSYGMTVPAIGMPGVFEYNLRVSVFDAEGRRVYRRPLSCSTGVGAPPAISQALFTVNNARQLRQMRDAEIHAAFEAVAEWCGMRLAAEMRRHAG